MPTLSQSQNATEDEHVAASALRKMSLRILPLLAFGYGFAYIDRSNISYAALQMNRDLHFSATVYGLGAGLFFLSYALFEVPSNLFLVHFGARRWITRIMVTWGMLAAAMLFVKTPMQFYGMRFLLGMAEAGFFPGVVFYLTHWYPERYSARAISRFYVAGPLSAALMGALAGPLLNLQGRLGLSGWQWLFLLEGLPAVLLGTVIWRYLPDSPEKASWLSESERRWIVTTLATEAVARVASPMTSVAVLLRSRLFWCLALANLCIMGSGYSFNLSAPTIIRGITHWHPTGIGLFMSCVAGTGALSMLICGWHSDHKGERYLHVALPLGLMAGLMLVIALSTTPAIVLTAYGVFYLAYQGVQATFWSIPGTAFPRAFAAVGLAAMVSVGMIGAFLGPYLFGMARDHTGSYKFGILAISFAYTIAMGATLLLRHRERPARAAHVELGAVG